MNFITASQKALYGDLHLVSFSDCCNSEANALSGSKGRKWLLLTIGAMNTATLKVLYGSFSNFAGTL